MSVFNYILNSSINNKENYLNFYLFGIIGYNIIETYKVATNCLYKYKKMHYYDCNLGCNIDNNWDAINYGVNNKCEFRMLESLVWPLGLIRQLLPILIYKLNRESIIDNSQKESFYEEYDSVYSDITVEKEE
jgi:hypothetical protein